MRRKARPVPGPELIDEERQPAAGGDAWVELAQRAGRGVPWVGEGGVALAFPLLVEAHEVGFPQKDLASHLEPRGRRLGLQQQRDASLGAEVGRHVLPHQPISAGGTLGQRALDVQQLHRQPVQLGLAVVRHLRRAQHLVHPLVEFDQPRLVEAVGQAEHGLAVLDAAEAFRRRPGHPAGGGIRGGQLGVGFFQRLQLAHQGVVFGVRYFGVIEDVVPLVVVGDVRTQPGHPLGCLGRLDVGGCHSFVRKTMP